MWFRDFIHYKSKALFCRYIFRIFDNFFDTHTKTNISSKKIHLFADIKKLNLTGIKRNYARELWRMWGNHRFDLLGSGWVRCGFVDNAPGIQGNRYSALSLNIDNEGNWLKKTMAGRNVKKAAAIWRHISPGYQPIDWQKDFKSGYRWDITKWYRSQGWADKPGGDIKVPWELSRMQHLPRMTVFTQILPMDGEKIKEEFRNQCLDFIAQNPPRMGVNWKCTMDVGIRTANMAIAYSLFCTNGYAFDEPFNQIFLQSIYEHCNHIRLNLEWSAVLTANHYFANVAGLLFGAALLPSSLKQKRWLAFACKEVKKEIEKQFYKEGSNFEGSTAYHRLSSDMAIYAAALISSLQKQSIEQRIADRLFGMAKFLEAVTRPDNDISQIGDNDGGLFFRFSPTGQFFTTDEIKKKYQSLSGYCPEKEGEFYLDENMNDGRTTISAISGLFETNEFFKAKRLYPLENSMVSMLCKGRFLRSEWKPSRISITPRSFSQEFGYHKETIIASGETNILSGLQRLDFPEFGIFLFRSDNIYLLVNAANNGQKGIGGHSHNDRLSFELFINGVPLYQDPGTYVYTALPEWRNKYRSVAAHNTISTGIEQNEFNNFFSLKNQSVCTLISISDKSISLHMEYRGIIHQRRFIIENTRIIMFDDCNKPFNINISEIAMTAGYGKLK